MYKQVTYTVYVQISTFVMQSSTKYVRVNGNLAVVCCTSMEVSVRSMSPKVRTVHTSRQLTRKSDATNKMVMDL